MLRRHNGFELEVEEFWSAAKFLRIGESVHGDAAGHGTNIIDDYTPTVVSRIVDHIAVKRQSLRHARMLSDNYVEAWKFYGQEGQWVRVSLSGGRNVALVDSELDAVATDSLYIGRDLVLAGS